MLSDSVLTCFEKASALGEDRGNGSQTETDRKRRKEEKARRKGNLGFDMLRWTCLRTWFVISCLVISDVFSLRYDQILSLYQMKGSLLLCHVVWFTCVCMHVYIWKLGCNKLRSWQTSYYQILFHITNRSTRSAVSHQCCTRKSFNAIPLSLSDVILSVLWGTGQYLPFAC